jgi:DNA-binding NarL/FixJ family response regulator
MSEPEEIRILVVDDHPIVRYGLATFLDAQPTMRVAAQAGSGEEAVQLSREHRPDIVLMDLRLPGMTGVEAIRAIRTESPRSRFVVMTTYEGDEDIHQALDAGAQAYLIKCMPSDALVDAILKVHAGLKVIPPPVAENLSDEEFRAHRARARRARAGRQGTEQQGDRTGSGYHRGDGEVPRERHPQPARSERPDRSRRRSAQARSCPPVRPATGLQRHCGQTPFEPRNQLLQ